MFLDEVLVTVSSALPVSKERSSKGLIFSVSDPSDPLIALWARTNLFPKVYASPSINEYRNSSLTMLICTKLGLTFLANTYDSKTCSSTGPTVTSIIILSTIDSELIHGWAFALGFFALSAALHFRIWNSIGKSAEIGYLISNWSLSWRIVFHYSISEFPPMILTISKYLSN